VASSKGGGEFAGESSRGGTTARVGISTMSAESNLEASTQPSPEKRAATGFARDVCDSPSKRIHRWASNFGGGIE
jgi:hypothetical protein